VTPVDPIETAETPNAAAPASEVPSPAPAPKRATTAARPSARTVEPVATPRADDAPSQAQLLRRAWTALNAGAAAEALAIVNDDVRRHPDGSLTEERAALNVLALEKLGRRDEARAASAAFATRYPTSVHRARIERALEETP
jgi:hypothetical protein